MNDIVITVGSANGSALALIRAIKEEIDCKAYVLCTTKQTAEVIASSKYVDEVYLVASEEEKQYISEIKRWYVTKSFDNKPMLYFTNDVGCYYVDNNRQWFEDNFILCLPSSEIIQTYTQKGLAEKAAEQVGLTVPKTRTIERSTDIDSIVEVFSFPAIIKPLATYLKGGINFKIKVLDNKEEFRFETEQIIADGNSLLCQEFIPGGNDTAWYYLFYRDSEGHIYNSMGKKTLQSSTNGGIMLKGRSEYNEEVSRICKSFLNVIDYKGIGGIEFKYHNGKYYFIEMSTRLEGFYQITENSKMPLSLISYYDLKGDKNKVKEYRYKRQKDGVEYVDFINLLINRIKSRKSLRLFKDISSGLFKTEIYLNYYDKHDRKPLKTSFLNLIRYRFKKQAND